MKTNVPDITVFNSVTESGSNALAQSLPVKALPAPFLVSDGTIPQVFNLNDITPNFRPTDVIIAISLCSEAFSFAATHDGVLAAMDMCQGRDFKLYRVPASAFDTSL